MTYKFARERADHSDFATGRVLHSAPGRTAFPVRLADEIFQRCLALRPADLPARVVLYDPVCGSAALLVTLGLLHGKQLTAVIGSDADREVLRIAERNLWLLTPAGLQQRLDALAHMHDAYGKSSHADAIASARRLEAMLADPPVPALWFQADALDPAAVQRGLESTTVPLADVIFADVPYGSKSFWKDGQSDTGPDPLWRLLEALRPVLAPGAVVAIATTKEQRLRHEAYVRREWFQIGKRRIELLAPSR
jgi:hypothetical protein